MRHPLTSKERRGLVAVAAAALLCIASGFIFRNCAPRSHPHAGVTVIDNDSVPSVRRDADSVSRKSASQPKDTLKNGKRSPRSKRKAAVRKSVTYRERQPLDEPCD
ncbi:MAG: hypothetical protein K2I92_05290 [Muribaculaceae bacterium]|nr:hypothetical protein [Muribaculaceae bacterium]